MCLSCRFELSMDLPSLLTACYDSCMYEFLKTLNNFRWKLCARYTRQIAGGKYEREGGGSRNYLQQWATRKMFNNPPNYSPLRIKHKPKELNVSRRRCEQGVLLAFKSLSKFVYFFLVLVIFFFFCSFVILQPCKVVCYYLKFLSMAGIFDRFPFVTFLSLFRLKCYSYLWLY